MDPLISTIVDEDELKTGVRREGAYYGVNSLIIRLSTIFIFIKISLVFTSTGWAVFDPIPVANTIFGLCLLMSFFPSIALGIVILSMIKSPISKDKHEKLKQEIEKLHAEKIRKSRE